jgi:drug/metabolite transporter (DMT)-like permease
MTLPSHANDQVAIRNGRLCIILASVLWSLNGAFFPILRNETPLNLHIPEVTPAHIGFFRVFFAGMVLSLMLRGRDFRFRPTMAFTAIAFAIMNYLFTTAMAKGQSAIAVFLQYTAPAWMTLTCVLILREPADRRGIIAVLIVTLGVVFIAWGGWEAGNLRLIGMALGSGFTFAMVLVGLRALRESSSNLITVLNHLVAAAVMVPLMANDPWPSAPQLGVLLAFGAVQMGLPYWLMARGLRSVSPQEAGMITLLEPLLSPLWSYLIAPQSQTPSKWTWIGGAFIVGALLFRYAPIPRRFGMSRSSLPESK